MYQYEQICSNENLNNKIYFFMDFILAFDL